MLKATSQTLPRVPAVFRVCQPVPYSKHSRKDINYFLWGGRKKQSQNAGHSTGCGNVWAARGTGGHGYAAGAAANGRAGGQWPPVVCFTYCLGENAVERRAQARREALHRFRNSREMFAKLAAFRPRAQAARFHHSRDRLGAHLILRWNSLQIQTELWRRVEFPAGRARLRGILAGEKIFTDGAANRV